MRFPQPENGHFPLPCATMPEEEPSKYQPVRQTIQQVLSRRIRRNFVARFLQTALDDRSEGSIIVDDMYKTRHEYVS
jgi:hypothetical protein